MLTKLYIDGFRLWRDTTIAFARGVPTVLIGPNGGGKTSVLEALAFLSAAASDGLRDAVYDARGGPSEFFRIGANRLSLAVWFEAAPGVPIAPLRGPVCYRLVLVRQGAFAQVEAEEISIFEEGPQRAPFVVLRRGPTKIESRHAKTGDWHSVPVADHESLALMLVRQDEDFPFLRIVREALGGLHIYPGFSTRPRWALDRQERSDSSRNAVVVRPQRSLDPRGRGLVNALHTLQQRDEHKWNYLQRQMTAEFPYCARIVFPADPGGSKLALQWQDTRFSGLRTAEQMSEGMWSFLLLLAALMPAEPAQVLAFDEPDVHLHPSALRRLVALLEEAAEQSTVLFTSHSTRVLDELAEPGEGLLICQPYGDGTSAQRLEAEHARLWVAEYDGVGPLRERGLLDRGNAL